MSDEVLVNVTPRETRVAIVENGLLQELFIERASRRGLVGNIYRGRVSRILPGMQAAFVELGLERTAFLHAQDILVPHADGEPSGERRQPESISMLLRDGQDVLVQVTKDPLGSKGARLTQHISIPSRYLVFMPAQSSIGVSQKIEDEAERVRLRDLLAEVRGDSDGGYIIRTAAEGVSRDEIEEDVRFLRKLWGKVQERAASPQGERLVYRALPLVQRVLRDLRRGRVETVRIDSRETWQTALEFARAFIPELVDRIEHYPGERPIFDLYSIEDEIRKALERKVQLKSGGHLFIDQTEAMTTIDINTGAFTGHRNLEETIFKTNLEAAQAIARQLRLRNLGGIIIIDFIDMTVDEHKRQVLRALEKAMETDRAKRYICEVSPLGLVEMTRERTRESLEHILCEPCPSCEGRGSVKTRETTCYEIFREILRQSRQFEAGSFLVMASESVVDLLLDEESNGLADLESFIGKTIKLQVETLYTQEQYDVVMM
ncbi:MAG: ribonuclease G [Chromatiales bacterium]|jgi:ribonuclease G|nr:ribonuclease G [Chromatiales bacterium]